MLEASALAGQLLAFQKGSAVAWMTEESSINFRQGKSSINFKASRQLRSPA
jgi:hypothetical protein